MICAVNKTETRYADCEKLLKKLAWDAHRKYGNTFDEFLSAANEGFARANATYNEKSSAKFSSWVYWNVKRTILDSLRKRTAEKRTRFSKTGDMTHFSKLESFNLESYISRLTDDGKSVVQLLLDHPLDLIEMYKVPEGVECIQEGLMKQLSDAGWCLSRCIKACNDIREELCL